MKKALLLVLIPAVTLWSITGEVHAFSDDRVPAPASQGWPWAHPALPALPAFSPEPPESSSPFAAQDVRGLTQYAPSLYDTLQPVPAPERPSQRWEGGDVPSRHPPGGIGGAQAKQYRFRGDKPPAEGDPEVEGDYHFRPLSAKERQRNQPASVWRPLSDGPQGATPIPLPGQGQPRGVFGPAGGGPWGDPGLPHTLEPAENAGRPDLEAENWFDRYYGKDRR